MDAEALPLCAFAAAAVAHAAAAAGSTTAALDEAVFAAAAPVRLSVAGVIGSVPSIAVEFASELPAGVSVAVAVAVVDVAFAAAPIMGIPRKVALFFKALGAIAPVVAALVTADEPGWPARAAEPGWPE